MSDPGDLVLDPDDHEHLIRRLGAAVVSCWSDLPVTVQDMLLSRTRVEADASDADDLDARLRLFVGSHLRTIGDAGRS